MELVDLVSIFGAVAFAVLAVVICLRWEPMMVLVFAGAILDMYLGLDVKLEVETVALRVSDGIAVMAAGAAILRLFVMRSIDIPMRWWLATCICWGVAAVYGAMLYGFITALSFYRQHFYLCAVAFYFMTFHLSVEEVRRLMVIWIAAATVIMIYSVIASINPALVGEFVADTGNLRAYALERVIVAGAAMVMCQAALICLGDWTGEKNAIFVRVLAIMLIVAMFLQYHRTTWLAFIASGLAMALISRRNFARLAPVLALVASVLIILWLAGLAVGQDFLTTAVTQAISEPLDERQSTAIWRIEGWRILVGEAIGQGPFRTLFGGGFGVGYERQMGNASIIYSPHNMYVEIFLNAGLIGLLPMLAFFGSLLQRALKRRRSLAQSDGLDPSIAIALIVSIIVYCISYSLGYDQAVLLGLLATTLSLRPAVPDQEAAR